MSRTSTSNRNSIYRRSTIRRSTDSDLAEIHAWLEDQTDRGVPGTFLCNWGPTEAHHRDGELLVYVDGKSGVPVAYQWGGLVLPGILEVRFDMRGNGIGRRLVERRVSEAYKRDECLLHIQCMPVSSVPFWRRMGFTLIHEDDVGGHAYRVLEVRHSLPTDSVPVSVVIRFYPENRKWEDGVAPMNVATPTAVRTRDDVVHLGERVFCFEALYPHDGDPVVEIEVDGRRQYFDKAKYEDAQRIGIRGCTNGFFVDRVLPQAPIHAAEPLHDPDR